MEGTTSELVTAPWQLHPESLTPWMPLGYETAAGDITNAMTSADKTSNVRADFLFIQSSPIDGLPVSPP